MPRGSKDGDEWSTFTRRRFIQTLTAAGVASAVGSGVARGQEVTEIRDWSELDAVRENLAGDYALAADLDEQTAGYDDLVATPADGWTPIGGLDENVAFEGTLDGKDHVIRDLVIDRPEENDVGLFGLVDGATVTNVQLEAVTVAGHDRVGGLTGASRENATVSHNAVGGTVTGEEAVGGLAGVNALDAVVRDSHVEGDVEGGTDVGGLVGYNDTDATVTRSSATGTVRSSDERFENSTGGLVGLNEFGATVRESYADCTVEGRLEVGGLVGYNALGATVVQSYAMGDVEATNEGVGGLVGWNAGAVVDECYAVGEVHAAEFLDAVGGLVGGNILEGEVSASYWDIETTGKDTGVGDEDEATSDVTGLTTDEMVGEAASEQMAALDFEATWGTLTSPESYPALQWEIAPDEDEPSDPDEPGDDTAEDEPDESENEVDAPENDDTADDDGPGFGVAGALVGFGGVTYLLSRRFAGTRTRDGG